MEKMTAGGLHVQTHAHTHTLFQAVKRTEASKKGEKKRKKSLNKGLSVHMQVIEKTYNISCCKKMHIMKRQEFILIDI